MKKPIENEKQKVELHLNFLPTFEMGEGLNKNGLT
jgi:hypothetical protein